jgi:hypothetical protein
VAIFSAKVALGGFLRYLRKCSDQKTFRNANLMPNETQRKSIWHYYELYLGPHFELAYQYSMIIAVNLMILLYAAALPHIWLIGTFVLCFIYVMDRILLAYSYRQPPVYDRKLVKFTLYVLQFSVIAYILMGAWIYSNQQAFRNVISTNNKTTEFQIPSQHTIGSIFETWNPGRVYVFGFILLLVHTVFHLYRHYTILRPKVRNLIRNLQSYNYFDVLNPKKREFWLLEDVVTRNRNDFSLISPQSFMEMGKNLNNEDKEAKHKA